ncbi:GNAT family N-acetyltransferase [Streptomyces durocortorensis]|uniref:GNAT family N-acetyltransferase n=1 Tax=Streptomyces durocortorensis TaxID=2811104 RepID=A0ABS2I0Z2_9ACTN|nr:GNAT family N-acetyltransferase [Streptomyces durocortorensis]MBM7056899.1 GNAT family N-acetyltransferase [Streptomyces durocortorensis]
MITIRPAREGDLDGFLALASQVEHWFGPMVEEPGFHRAVEAHIRDGAALIAESTEPADASVAVPGAAPGLSGGLLFGAAPPTYHVHWLVTSEHRRGAGVGRLLMAEAMRRYVRGPGTVEVVTFGPDHPGAVESGARAFYEKLGFAPGEPADPGPEGGSRQIYRLDVPDSVRPV